MVSRRYERPSSGHRRSCSSSFCNLSVTHELCRGCLIADVPAIVGSLDIVMGEIDR
jgi:NADH-quinone oxidoreductase subunit D